MKKKKIKNSSKYGVYKGNVINSDNIVNEGNLTAEEYKDDFLSIQKTVETADIDDDKDLALKKRNKKNFIVYKVFGYIIIILLLLTILVVILVIK
ncbi:hypothetical protein SLITO_v1c01570 [Spiroplasma litorale]|uniref:Uncharacterized protein n=1 Tax=Spiroplasma litorale TaxID=216942 RepID=A0A0K1W0Y4_9MOLU|nr:hypothetical protein [Spiroplasma litorale]AKX33823.1 hypothetical protein SLITO_v1c01570 [Spiroplasma litorale]